MWTRFVCSLGIGLAALATVGAQQPETFGTGVSLTEMTPLARVLERPGDFEGKTVRVEGIVTAVCMHMGCWMALAADHTPNAPTVLVKVDDGVIVFPPSAKGRRASAQGVMERIRAGNAEGQEAAAEHAKSASPAGKSVPTSWQLKTTGAVVF